MKYISYFLFLALLTTSCNWFKKKTKDTVNKTGEIVAKTGSEFADGIKKGVEKTFANEIALSTDLKNEGLQTGKVLINSSDSTSDNILTVYLVFEKDFTKNITIKLFDENDKEYGRITQTVTGKMNEAKYIDFIFDKRTNIDGKSKVSLE